MSATIIQQGNFVSTGVATTLPLVAGVDWMEIINYTQMAAANAGSGVEFKWQKGMAPGTGVEYQKTAATNVLNGLTLTSGGFTPVLSTFNAQGPLTSTITAISGATPPVVTTSAPHGLSVNQVVRLINITGAQQLGGFDFTIGNSTLTSTTFSLDYMSTIVAGTTGSFILLPFAPNFDPMFYPSKRSISAITQATNAVITMTVQHNLTAGQQIRVKCPKVYGMKQIDSLIGNIISVNTSTNTITTDINSTAFTAFAFPLTGTHVAFDIAEVIPVGETANGTFANNLQDAERNVSITGMTLGAGVNGPAGSASDVIYWKAGKSTM